MSIDAPEGRWGLNGASRPGGFRVVCRPTPGCLLPVTSVRVSRPWSSVCLSLDGGREHRLRPSRLRINRRQGQRFLSYSLRRVLTEPLRVRTLRGPRMHVHQRHHRIRLSGCRIKPKHHHHLRLGSHASSPSMLSRIEESISWLRVNSEMTGRKYTLPSWLSMSACGVSGIVWSTTTCP